MGSPASHGVPHPPQGWQPSHGIGDSFAVESAAAFAWNRWQACYGISGSFRVERVAALPWNQWQDSPGIGGSFAVEYAASSVGSDAHPKKGCEHIIKKVRQGQSRVHCDVASRVRGCGKEAQDEVATGSSVEGKVGTVGCTRLKPRRRIARQEISIGWHMLHPLPKFR